MRTLRTTLALTLLVAACGLPGCLKRFNTCETNVECTERESDSDLKTPYCVNLRCVQCRNDEDCGAKGYCNRTTNECQKVD